MRKVAKKNSNKVRITGGRCRSQFISFPTITDLRPSTGFIREKVFNWLGQTLTDQVILDLFAGSGAFAFESASRGAKTVVAVEHNAQACAFLLHNRRKLVLPQVIIKQIDALTYLRQKKQVFDFIFLDPPYRWQDWPQLWQLLPACLKENGQVYIESDRQLTVPSTWRIEKMAKHGISYLLLVALN